MQYCRIHIGVSDGSGLVGCDTVILCECFLMFRWITVPSSLRVKQGSLLILQRRRHCNHSKRTGKNSHILEDPNLCVTIIP